MSYFRAPRVYKYLFRGDGHDNRDARDVLEMCERFNMGQNDKFIVHDDSDRTYWCFDTYKDFTVWFAQNPTHRTLHEVIRGNMPQKLKFDIDAPVDSLDLLEDLPFPEAPTRSENIEEYGEFAEILQMLDDRDIAEYEEKVRRWYSQSARTRKAKHMLHRIIDGITACFHDTYGIQLGWPDIVCSGSSDNTKCSHHFVITNYSVINSQEAKLFTQKLIDFLPADVIPCIDQGVNKNTQNFRLPECHKSGSTRVKKITSEHSFDDMIITRTINTAQLNPTGVAHISTAQAVNITSAEEAEILEVAKPYLDGFRFRNRVGTLFNFTRIHPTLCEICNITHHKDNTLFICVCGDSVKLHCRHADQHSLCIGTITKALPIVSSGKRKEETFGEVTVPKKFIPYARIPTSFSVEQYAEPGLKDFRFYGNKYDTLLIKSGMGTGKTKKLLEYIADLPEQIRIVVVSFRRSFTTELMNKLTGFTDYRQISGSITAKRVVIQFESIHRLAIPVGESVLLVLDETEQIIGQIENRQMAAGGTLRKCWEVFQWFMMNSAKVIAMDAYASFRTFTLLEKTRNSVHMHNNTYVVPDHSTDFHYTTLAEFLTTIYEAAPTAQKSPFVVISTCKKQSDAIGQKIRELNPTANVKSYNSDSNDEERTDFNDVNTAWADVDVLIFTSTISAGCSFELERFDRIYAYFTDKSNDYKTCIQMLGRIRNVGEKEYHIYIRESFAHLPDTLKAVERALADRAEIGGIISNPLDSPKFINSSGEYEYSLKDLYYHIHVANIMHRCQSRNHFKYLFLKCRSISGIRCEEVDGTGGPMVEHENGEVIQKLREKDRTNIAEARAITAEEAVRLKHIENPTAEQRNSLTAYKLTEHYKVPYEAITQEFVKKYNKPKVMAAYHNLNMLRGREDTIKESINRWRKFKDAKDTESATAAERASVDDLNTSNNLLKCMFAADVLNELLKTNGKYCDTQAIFGAQYLARSILENNIDSVIETLRKNAELVALLFDVRIYRIKSARTDMKGKLALINTILAGAFGLKFAAVRQKVGVSDMFILSEPKLFKYCEKSQRYVITTAVPMDDKCE